MSSICVGCGLCCDGTLFVDVGLRDGDDTHALVMLGLPIAKHSDGLRFAQPCPASSGGCCTIYDDRPTVCRSYRCPLLVRQEAGEVSFEMATERIATALELRDEVVAGVDRLAPTERPTAVGASSPALLALLDDRQGGVATPAVQADATGVLRALATLRSHLKSHFDLDLNDGSSS